ncbi:hypothetical protein [Ramlibacter sp. PS4R-6]|uniref:hypothetical protein n=1 Tax=Ramlibacter sp. PS4R-6 TaxID=3133438 RepID=UPI0030A9F6BA
MRRLPFFAPPARPVLYLGLVGFTPAETRLIESQLELAPVGGVHWVLAPFAGADAWMINGARTHVLAPDEVCVAAASPAEDSVRLRLAEVDRPVAFSRPLADADFEPACTFELSSVSSLVILLAKFSQWLRPRAMLLALADLLTLHAANIRRRSRVWHLTCDNRLVGVVDLQGDIGVLPDATLGDLARASWLPRPDAAGYVPDNFARKSIAGLLWEYAGRTQRDLLPARYRESPIHLKRAPLLGYRLFNDAQLFVLRELAQAPRTLAELCASATFSAQEIARALAAFYLVGSVTSSSKRADAAHRESAASVWPWWMSQQPESVPGVPDFTAPGALPLAH